MKKTQKTDIDIPLDYRELFSGEIIEADDVACTETAQGQYWHSVGTEHRKAVGKTYLRDSDFLLMCRRKVYMWKLVWTTGRRRFEPGNQRKRHEQEFSTMPRALDFHPPGARTIVLLRADTMGINAGKFFTYMILK